MYKDTQMNAYNITKLIAELKNGNNVLYGNKMHYFVGRFVGVATESTCTRIVLRRQVTVRFMN